MVGGIWISHPARSLMKHRPSRVMLGLAHGVRALGAEPELGAGVLAWELVAGADGDD
jgi:hypothetical protein